MRRGVSILLAGVLMMAGYQARGEIVPQVFRDQRGVVVWLASRPTLPFVVIKVLVRAGSVYDTDAKAGVAYMVSQLLPEGAGGMTGPQISQTLDYMGSELDTGCTKEYATLTLVSLKEHLEESFRILSTVLTRPDFREEDFQRVKREVLGELLKEEEDPGTVASRAFDERLFGKHPYHRPEKGYPSTVEALSLDDVKSFYKRFYSPNFAIFSVAGDITREELEDLMNRYLKEWSPSDTPLPSIPDPLPLAQPRKVVLDKDVTQANIVMGHLGIKRSNPDFTKVYVMNQILGGGGLTSRLFQRVREEGGFSYSVYSYFQPSYWRGAFKVVLQTRNDRAQEAIEEVVKVLKEYREKGPTPQELEDAKRYLTGSFPLRLDTNQEIADYMAFAALHHLGTHYFVRFPKEIDAVTLEEVREAALKYLHPERLLEVVVKKPSSP